MLRMSPPAPKARPSQASITTRSMAGSSFQAFSPASSASDISQLSAFSALGRFMVMRPARPSVVTIRSVMGWSVMVSP